ncbi:CcdC protein domain-containing protein [Paenibacillus tuaregi]|uniref:CcdC protein domain-containing protein n=1 Tax=Paenibacillus tuaregi TaxID=1816681 RepID=UPI0008385706|nr:CcdC protein domain-containing protein [Paenibacillus tuaregi]
MMDSPVYLIVLVIILLRLGREREVRPANMWIVPALFTYMTIGTLAETHDFTAVHILMYLMGAAVGTGIGFLRGKLERFRVHPSTGNITTQSSIGSIVLFVGVILLRLLVKYMGSADMLIPIGNALLLVSLASICTRRCYVYLRYRQLQGQRY